MTEQNPSAGTTKDPIADQADLVLGAQPRTRRVQLGHHHAGDHTMPSAGGRGDEPWPEIDMILADVYSAGAEGLQFEGVARRAAVRAAVAALAAQPSPAAAVPTGWKLAPIEPTWSMRNDGREFLIDGIEKEPERLAYFLWKTMINAAPPAQAVDLDELRRAACVVGVVGQIDGHDVVRRNSVLDVIDTRRQRLTDSQAVGNAAG